MKKDLVTPEWLSSICLELDGDSTVIGSSHVEQNALIQNYHNKHYLDILRAVEEDYEPELEEV